MELESGVAQRKAMEGALSDSIGPARGREADSPPGRRDGLGNLIGSTAGVEKSESTEASSFHLWIMFYL